MGLVRTRNMVGAVLGISALTSCSYTSDVYNPASTDEKITAQVMCEDFVKDRLKAPATAEFGNLGDEGVTWNAGRGLYVVRDTVDAENSFGAKIRSDFVCKIKTTDQGDSWTLVGLSGLN